MGSRAGRTGRGRGARGGWWSRGESGCCSAKELLDLSLREIGAAFGDRDSSTVLSALARAREDLADSTSVAERVARLRQMLPAPGATQSTSLR
jgi:hypothetical protein